MSPTLRQALLAAIAMLGAIAGLVLGARDTHATPIYAVRSVNACDTCHIEPSGWGNPPVPERRCSLDCNTCHVSPTGGGMRNQSGRYYGMQTLPTWGKGPGDGTDPGKYLPEGHPEEGRYRIGEGFSGWWPGELHVPDIEDRYGSLDPDPAIAVGGDARFMSYTLLGEHFESWFFPMQAELYLMARPKRDKLVFYVDAGLNSDREGLNLLGQDAEGPAADAIDYFRVREVFVMVDRLPNKMYLRAGRINPPFGWRLPDHTGFTRRRLGFDQDRQVFAIEGGWNPNYPYANVALFREGLAAWPGDSGEPGWGISATAGTRRLGWHGGGSLMAKLDDDGDRSLALGPLGALNLYPVVLLAEIDLLTEVDADGAGAAHGLYAYQETNVLLTKGVSTKLKLDWRDEGLSTEDDMTTRFTIGAEWHPVRHAHVEAQYLRQYDGFELFGHDIIVMLHGWY